MRMRGGLVGVACAVLLAACGGSNSSIDSEVDADDSPASTLAATSTTAASPQLPGPASFAEPASALYDRDNPTLPPPLIDLSLLVSGGPPPDGIPPVDEPKYLAVDEVEFLQPQDSVLVVEIDGDARAFPVAIMIWHEIANVEVGGTPITVSYCPLCNSAVAFLRTHPDGTVMDFGTSGLLFNSALVMYDRQTASLWTHFDGLAVHGVLAGNRLERLPMATTSFADFAAAHPDGLVLSLDTGSPRDYGINPYPTYDSPTSGTLYPVDFEVSAIPGKTRILVVREGESIAVVHDLLFEERVVAFEADGRRLVAWLLPGTASALDRSAVALGRDVGATGLFVPEVDGRILTFEPTDDGFRDLETGSRWNIFGIATEGEFEGRRLERVEHLDTFWFAIAAYRPDTLVVGAELFQP